MGHGRHALKNLDPGVGARVRRMNLKIWSCEDLHLRNICSDVDPLRFYASKTLHAESKRRGRRDAEVAGTQSPDSVSSDIVQQTVCS